MFFPIVGVFCPLLSKFFHWRNGLDDDGLRNGFALNFMQMLLNFIRTDNTEKSKLCSNTNGCATLAQVYRSGFRDPEKWRVTILKTVQVHG